MSDLEIEGSFIEIDTIYKFAWIWRFLITWADNKFEITLYKKGCENIAHFVCIEWA